MSIVICILEDDHPYQAGDTIMEVKRLGMVNGIPTWLSKVAMFMEMDAEGNVTPLRVGSGERIIPGSESTANDDEASN